MELSGSNVKSPTPESSSGPPILQRLLFSRFISGSFVTLNLNEKEHNAMALLSLFLLGINALYNIFLSNISKFIGLLKSIRPQVKYIIFVTFFSILYFLSYTADMVSENSNQTIYTEVNKNLSNKGYKYSEIICWTKTKKTLFLNSTSSLWKNKAEHFVKLISYLLLNISIGTLIAIIFCAPFSEKYFTLILGFLRFGLRELGKASCSYINDDLPIIYSNKPHDKYISDIEKIHDKYNLSKIELKKRLAINFEERQAGKANKSRAADPKYRYLEFHERVWIIGVRKFREKNEKFGFYFLLYFCLSFETKLMFVWQAYWEFLILIRHALISVPYIPFAVKKMLGHLDQSMWIGQDYPSQKKG